MKHMLAVLAICFLYAEVHAQKIIDPKVRYYTWIYLNTDSKPVIGVILETGDSTIQFIQESQLKESTAVHPFSSDTIPVHSIEKIRVRRKGAIGKGILIGGIGGMLTGAIVGYASGDDKCEPGSWCIFTFSAEDKAVMGGVVGLLPGVIVGAIAGSKRKTIHINGDQSLYFNSRSELINYTLTNR